MEKKRVIIREGASIGAGAICVAPVEIGRWSVIGAGAVVVEDTEAFGLYVGNPARRIGWVNKDGLRLFKRGSKFYCKETKRFYRLTRLNQDLVEII